MRATKIGQRVDVDLFGLRLPGGDSPWDAVVASGIVVGIAPGSITVRLDEHLEAEITVGPARLVRHS
jgi:hypothetical protein